MIIIQIHREITIKDEMGRPIISKTRDGYRVDDRDFQPYDNNVDGLVIDETTGLVKNSFRSLFLRTPLNKVKISLGEVVECAGEFYKVVDVMRYPNHTECTLALRK